MIGLSEGLGDRTPIVDERDVTAHGLLREESPLRKVWRDGRVPLRFPLPKLVRSACRCPECNGKETTALCFLVPVAALTKLQIYRLAEVTTGENGTNTESVFAALRKETDYAIHFSHIGMVIAVAGAVAAAEATAKAEPAAQASAEGGL